jgi:hypothetical protein
MDQQFYYASQFCRQHEMFKKNKGSLFYSHCAWSDPRHRVCLLQCQFKYSHQIFFVNKSNKNSSKSDTPFMKKNIKKRKIKMAGISNDTTEMRNVLECPICWTLAISGPIKQCKNGHHICANCASKVPTATWETM